MKISKIKILFLFLFTLQNQSKSTQKDQINKKNKQQLKKNDKKQHDRKLYFSPYLNSFEDYSAKKVGEQDQGDSQPYLGATPVGTQTQNMSSIIPTGFSGGYTLPGSQMFPMGHLGAVNNIQTTALYNPLGNNPILQAGNTSLSMPGVSQQVNQSLFVNLHAPPQIKVLEQCQSVMKQAIKIANAVMENQFEQMADYITLYLKESGHTNQMSELKLTRELREKMYQHMMAYSNLSIKNVNFTQGRGMSDVSQQNLIKNLKDLSGDNVDFVQKKENEFNDKI